MTRFAVRTRYVQEVTVMVDAPDAAQALREAEAVALGFRNAIAAKALSAKPADTKTLQEARRSA